MMHHEAVKFSAINATTAAFSLNMGGLYQVAAHSADWTGPGTVTLEQLGPDGSTYLTVTTPITADGGAQYYLPPGLYKFVLASVTASCSVVRIPLC